MEANETKAGGSTAEVVTLHVPFPESFVYSSASSFSLTMMDLKIGFGEAMPDRTVQSRVGVTLPIEHAAHIALTLIGQLFAFEENFGPIRHPAWNLVKSQLATIAPDPKFPGKPYQGETVPTSDPESQPKD